MSKETAHESLIHKILLELELTRSPFLPPGSSDLKLDWNKVELKKKKNSHDQFSELDYPTSMQVDTTIQIMNFSSLVTSVLLQGAASG